MPTIPTDTYIISGGKATIKKDPDADLDYTMEWAPWLTAAGDVLLSVHYTVFDGDGLLTTHSEGVTGTLTGVWLAGGTVGMTYRVSAHITTANSPNPRIDDRSFFVKIVER